MDFEKLKREEEELENELYGKSEKPKDEESNAPDTEDDPIHSSQESFDEDEDQSDDQSITDEEGEGEDDESDKPKGKRVSWKQRFSTFKAATDRTIHNLRMDNAQLKSEKQEIVDQYNELNGKYRELFNQSNQKIKEKSLDDLFTEEDIDIIGPEAIDIFKRALSKTQVTKERDPEVDDLKAELQRIRQSQAQSAKKEAEDLKNQALENLKVKLSRIVPGWETIDKEQGFAQFIHDYDEDSGLIRKDLLAQYVHLGDVRSVARLYNEYKELKPATKDDILGKHVTPTGTGASSHSGRSNKKTYSIHEYEQFMNDVAKGKYRGSPEKIKEARIIEARFDKAFMEGRIT